MILQIKDSTDVITDVISTNDATIIGILLAVILAMGFLLRYYILKTDRLEKENRAQEKANMQFFSELVTTVKDVGTSVNNVNETSSENNTLIQELRLKSESILNIIKERLSK